MSYGFRKFNKEKRQVGSKRPGTIGQKKRAGRIGPGVWDTLLIAGRNKIQWFIARNGVDSKKEEKMGSFFACREKEHHFLGPSAANPTRMAPSDY